MSAKAAQQKAPGVLAVLLFFQLVVMSISARHPNGDHSVLSSWVMAAITPVVKGVDKAISAVTGAIGGIADLRNARAENAQLKKEVEELTVERDQARERAASVEPLRIQLALPPNPDYPQLAANIVSRDAGGWFRHLFIDRGTLDGVKLNMPVTTAMGIVGRIIEVGPNYSRVQVITDQYAGVGGMLQGSRAMGEVKGLKSSRCELKNISASYNVEVGEAVITTGLDGIYPKGLMVGTVEQVESDPNAPWHKLIINPSAPIDRLEQVFVILVSQRDLKMQETIK